MKKLFNIKPLLFILPSIFFISSSVVAISLKNVEVKEPYGRGMSHEKACIIAKDRLFDKARRMAAGEETMSAESTQVCEFTEEQSRCKLITNSFRSIGRIIIVDYEPIIYPDGTDCKFASLGNNIFEAQRKGNFILKKLPKQSPNFNFTVSMNKNEFISYPENLIKNVKSNDSLNISIETMQDMYVSIFQWSPYEDTLTVNKIFPNKVDLDNFFKQNIKYSIPTSNKIANYRLRVDFPNEEFMMQDEVVELIMVIGTVEKINFLNDYTYSEFGEMLGVIEQFKKKEKSYLIRKRKN